ncbi:ankyrin repeat, SAM and basic leucine zipper domain-containing protein 1-like [Notothenia coriiceps]|uniref:Ankyrin repeat, SAM and basic leucine zipper domain-containing protein 1-like n=1 Tax=Notothenia coriiceps TaxID=8208 RepID=A0A6I9PY28_9TELE|nr:PREDICTED: ankyrin repeat, SAM and basic leucine zipper domain-containing protein 1-like [Notothenia coriiceps]
MDIITANSFPAGDESEGSNDDWDICFSLDNKSPQIKDQDAVVPHAQDNVSLLKQAISKGDIGAVKQLLDDGMDVETRLGFDWTPLMCAVSVVNYELTELLLDRGASANFSKGQTNTERGSDSPSANRSYISYQHQYSGNLSLPSSGPAVQESSG